MRRAPDYIKATNKAYELLLRFNFMTPVDVHYIAYSLIGNRLRHYTRQCDMYPIGRELLMQTSEYGFTLMGAEGAFILYNERQHYETQRFTVAHELGHLLLSHNEEDWATNAEANCFARNLLCPALVADEFGVYTVEGYRQTFDISQTVAQLSLQFKKVDLLNTSDEWYQRVRAYFADMFGYCPSYDAM